MAVINPKKLVIRETLDLSKAEQAVLDELLAYRMARNVSRIARNAGIPRTTALYILRRFKERKIVKDILNGKRYLWMYNRTIGPIRRAF